MTFNDIETLINTDETRNLELKKTTGELKDGMKSACAFLNTDGGWLIFGVHPTTLKLTGQDVTENTRREIAQALINALCHREYDNPRTSVSLAIYDDRIEIVNPGRFPAQLTPETIKLQHDSYPYNIKIAQVLYQATYLESWGSGVKRMIDLCEAQHISDPEFKLGDNTVTIIFHRHHDSQNDSQSDSQKQLNERQKKILMLMRNNNRLSVASIAAKLSLSEATIYRDIRKINTVSELYWKGSPKTDHWTGAVFDSQL